jgi:hypothetical protein
MILASLEMRLDQYTYLGEASIIYDHTEVTTGRNEISIDAAVASLGHVSVFSQKINNGPAHH